MANVSIKDKEVQKSLKENVGRIISVRGVLKAGDPINPLTGDALEKDIAFQKNTQHRRYLLKDPHFKFTISGAELLKPEDGKKTAAEAYIAQSIYGDDKLYTVETRTDRAFAIGYKKADGVPKLINRESIAEKHFAHGQEITINFKVYEPKDGGDCGVGFENIVFSEQPKFWEGSRTGALGAFADWDVEADDLNDAEVVKDTGSEPDDSPEAGTSDDVWQNDWE